MYKLDWNEFDNVLATKDRSIILPYLEKHDLEIVDNMIVAKKRHSVSDIVGYWDKLQLVRKIMLNSLYGGLLNNGCRFNDPRLGQSTTLSGRQVVKHLNSAANEAITGVYDIEGQSVIYSDTDSILGDTIINTNKGPIQVQDLFDQCKSFKNDGEKEYAFDPDIKVLSYDDDSKDTYYGNINYVYRHRVSKDLYAVTDEYNNTITVTADHSIIIFRNNTSVIGVKPTNFKPDDKLIIAKDGVYVLSSITNVELVRTADNEYVYDIGMSNADHPWFFGNSILAHNSCYFSAYEFLKPQIESGEIEWTKDSVVKYYDAIADHVNTTFVDFMQRAFNVPPQRGAVIKAGREIVGSTALFITKKRYAVMVYDKEGKRYDKDSPGDIKAMGLDLRRSDTPEYIQKFLMAALEMVLTEHPEKEIIDFITQFRLEFRKLNGWEKGTPKRANNMTMYTAVANDETTKGRIPGHVTASINWNTMLRIHKEKHVMPIIDGMKVIVCKLKPNQLGITSIAYPVDEPTLPDWFKEMPFDHDEMENVLIDKKIENMLTVLNWDLAESKEKNMFNQLFDW